MANAIAVFPVPGAPAINTALPAIFFCFIISTITPPASRANSYPTIPYAISSAYPSSPSPSPFT